MQIIPSTANAVAERLGITGHDLRDPVMSLTLGQEYLRMLLADANVANDLFLMTIAYNAGPGNLAKWRKQFAYDDDPLLFIESIPSRETRMFVERVMAGLWIYQARLGQPALSLDAVASGVPGRPIDARTPPRWPLPMPRIDETRPFHPVNIAVLTVSDTRDRSRRQIRRDPR